MVVPSLPSDPQGGPYPVPGVSKDALRRAALDARKAFVATLSDAGRALLERRLAENLTSFCAGAKVVAGYAPMGSEISPMVAIEEARAVGAVAVFPAFHNPAKPFRFLAGDPAAAGPFGILQPKASAPPLDPDLVLIPLIAVDGRGMRLGRGKGHYDRVLARLHRSGAKLVGVGWPLQRLSVDIPHDPWDVPLDAFVTPESVEVFSR